MIRLLPIVLMLPLIGCSDYDAITKVWNGRQILKDGREYSWVAGGNESGDCRVVVISYYATKGKERLVLKPGVTYSSNDPLPGMRGSAILKPKYPPDSSVSGLYVDGMKKPLSEGINVAFVSNISDLECFVIKKNDADAFFRELRETPWDEFFNRQIKPRLKNWSKSKAHE